MWRLWVLVLVLATGTACGGQSGTEKDGGGTEDTADPGTGDTGGHD